MLSFTFHYYPAFKICSKMCHHHHFKCSKMCQNKAFKTWAANLRHAAPLRSLFQRYQGERVTSRARIYEVPFDSPYGRGA